MHAKSWSDQHQQRFLLRKFVPWKIAKLRQLAAALVPGNAGPVIHALQWQMDILIGLEFDHGEPRLASFGENVDHGAIGCGKRWHLRVDKFRAEPSIERDYVAGNQRFQPTLGMHAPQG